MLDQTLEEIGIPRERRPELLYGEPRIRHMARVGGRYRGESFPFFHLSPVPVGICQVCSRLVVRPSLYRDPS